MGMLFSKDFNISATHISSDKHMYPPGNKKLEKKGKFCLKKGAPFEKRTQRGEFFLAPRNPLCGNMGFDHSLLRPLRASIELSPIVPSPKIPSRDSAVASTAGFTKHYYAIISDLLSSRLFYTFSGETDHFLCLVDCEERRVSR